MDKPEAVKVLDSREEAEGVRTVTLDKDLGAGAGQFVMLWIPEVGEKPFTLSRTGEESEVTFDVKGRFTRRLASMGAGDLIGVRGPYGNGWDLEGKRDIAVVAGGLGLAAVMPVIESRKCAVIYGTKSADLIIFKDRLERSEAELIYTTDDGSYGRHCYACDALEGVLGSGDYDLVLTCGPEAMMKVVVDICLRKGISCQASLERWMKCGIGLCGSCVIDPSGLRVCKDGPVFTAEQLEGTEFGEYARGKSGAKKEF